MYKKKIKLNHQSLVDLSPDVLAMIIFEFGEVDVKNIQSLSLTCKGIFNLFNSFFHIGHYVEKIAQDVKEEQWGIVLAYAFVRAKKACESQYKKLRNYFFSIFNIKHQDLYNKNVLILQKKLDGFFPRVKDDHFSGEKFLKQLGMVFSYKFQECRERLWFFLHMQEFSFYGKNHWFKVEDFFCIWEYNRENSFSNEFPSFCCNPFCLCGALLQDGYTKYYSKISRESGLVDVTSNPFFQNIMDKNIYWRGVSKIVETMISFHPRIQFDMSEAGQKCFEAFCQMRKSFRENNPITELWITYYGISEVAQDLVELISNDGLRKLHLDFIVGHDSKSFEKLLLVVANRPQKSCQIYLHMSFYYEASPSSEVYADLLNKVKMIAPSLKSLIFVEYFDSAFKEVSSCCLLWKLLDEMSKDSMFKFSCIDVYPQSLFLFLKYGIENKKRFKSSETCIHIQRDNFYNTPLLKDIGFFGFRGDDLKYMPKMFPAVVDLRNDFSGKECKTKCDESLGGCDKKSENFFTRNCKI